MPGEEHPPDHRYADESYLLGASLVSGRLRISGRAGDGEEIDEEACPYAGYYHFSREQENETYHPVPGTEWYYEGVFWSGMPDLNLEKEAVRRELEKAASFWIELGADGFRMDAALHYEENNTAFNTEVLRWMYDYCLQQNPDFYMVSEVWAGEKTIADYYGSGTPSLFNFDLADAEGKLIKAARGKYSAESLVDAMISYQEDFFRPESGMDRCALPHQP